MQQEIQQEVTRSRGRPRVVGRAALALGVSLAPALAHASLLSGEALDTAANVISWIVIIFVPLAAIGLFLYVHVLPEVIAERQHHPQKQSIKVLCILSLFFGGLLWPLAWLWAYTKPVGYRAAYGTEKHDDHYLAIGERLRLGSVDAKELAQARAELAAMQAKGSLSPQLRALVADIDSITAVPARETA
jgi:CBS domain containing-hemolysin-like protein